MGLLLAVGGILLFLFPKVGKVRKVRKVRYLRYRYESVRPQKRWKSRRDSRQIGEVPEVVWHDIYIYR